MYGAIGSSMLAGFLIAKLTQRARGSAAKLRKLPARVFEEIAFLPEQWTLRPHDFKVNGAFLFVEAGEDSEAQFNLLLHTGGGWSMFKFVSPRKTHLLRKMYPQLYRMGASSLEGYNTDIEKSYNLSQARKVANTLREIFTGAELITSINSVSFQGSAYTFKRVTEPDDLHVLQNVGPGIQSLLTINEAYALNKSTNRFKRISINRTLGRLINATLHLRGYRRSFYGLVNGDPMLGTTDGNVATVTFWPDHKFTVGEVMMPKQAGEPFFSELLQHLEREVDVIDFTLDPNRSFLHSVQNFPQYSGSGTMSVISSFTQPQHKTPKPQAFGVYRGEQPLEFASNFRLTSSTVTPAAVIKIFNDSLSNKESVLLSAPTGFQRLLIGRLPEVSVLVKDKSHETTWTCTYNPKIMTWTVTVKQGKVKKPKHTKTTIHQLLKRKEALFRLRIEYEGYEIPLRTGGNFRTTDYVFQHGLSRHYLAHLVDMMATGIVWFFPQGPGPQKNMRDPMCFLYRPVDQKVLDLASKARSQKWTEDPETFSVAIEMLAPSWPAAENFWASDFNNQGVMENIPDEDVVEKIFCTEAWTDQIGGFSGQRPKSDFLPEQFLPYSEPLFYLNDVDGPLTWYLVMPIKHHSDWIPIEQDGYSDPKTKNKKAKKNG